MHRDAYANTWHRSTFGFYSTTELGTPSWFATSQEGDKILWEVWIYEYWLWFLPSYFSLSHILPNPKDTHKEVFNFHSDIVIYPLDNPRSSQTPTNAVLYMPLILQFRPPLSVISLLHQPLISPSFKQNTEPTIISYSFWRRGKKITTIYPASSFLPTKNCSFFYQATFFFLLQIPSLILIQPPILPIFLAPMNCASPSIFNCHPISHNTQATNLPTHNH